MLRSRHARHQQHGLAARAAERRRDLHLKHGCVLSFRACNGFCGRRRYGSRDRIICQIRFIRAGSVTRVRKRYRQRLSSAFPSPMCSRPAVDAAEPRILTQRIGQIFAACNAYSAAQVSPPRRPAEARSRSVARRLAQRLTQEPTQRLAQGCVTAAQRLRPLLGHALRSPERLLMQKPQRQGAVTSKTTLAPSCTMPRSFPAPLWRCCRLASDSTERFCAPHE